MNNKMIMKLIPGNDGKDCPYNGKHKGADDKYIECRCDECDYMMCCIGWMGRGICKTCEDYSCPRLFE